MYNFKFKNDIIKIINKNLKKNIWYIEHKKEIKISNNNKLIRIMLNVPLCISI